MSGSFEERAHAVRPGCVRTTYDATPATITKIAITATTRTVRGFLFPPRRSIPGGAPAGGSLAATHSPPVRENGARHITLCAATFQVRCAPVPDACLRPGGARSRA